MTEQLAIDVDTPQRYRFSIDEYLALDEHGMFAEAGKTELLDGTIYQMNAQHRPHAWVKSQLHLALAAALRDATLDVVVEVSVALSRYDAPEPDLVVTSQGRGTGLVPLDSVALVIEVADATLKRDVSVKLAAYARAGVAEYWVADVQGAIIRQFWGPAGDLYTHSRAVAFGSPITAERVAGLTIDTSGLL